MKTSSAIYLLLLAFLSNTPSSASAADTPDEWYETFQEIPLYPQLLVEQKRDENIFSELKIREIMALLRYELKERDWPDFDKATQRNLLRILSDPELRIIYTGRQSKLAHSSGGQTIDKNTIKINGDGFLRQGAPKSPFEIARILIHEIGHVSYLRDFSLPHWNKETFPEKVEEQLSEENFTKETVDKITEYFQAINPIDINGTWHSSVDGGTGTYSVRVKDNRIIWTASGMWDGKQYQHKAEGTILGNRFDVSIIDTGGPWKGNTLTTTGIISDDGSTINLEGLNPFENQWKRSR